jgi:hypothetical protein
MLSSWPVRGISSTQSSSFRTMTAITLTPLSRCLLEKMTEARLRTLALVRMGTDEWLKPDSQHWRRFAWEQSNGWSPTLNTGVDSHGNSRMTEARLRTLTSIRMGAVKWLKPDSEHWRRFAWEQSNAWSPTPNTNVDSHGNSQMAEAQLRTLTSIRMGTVKSVMKSLGACGEVCLIDHWYGVRLRRCYDKEAVSRRYWNFSVDSNFSVNKNNILTIITR